MKDTVNHLNSDQIVNVKGMRIFFVSSPRKMNGMHGIRYLYIELNRGAPNLVSGIWNLEFGIISGNLEKF